MLCIGEAKSKLLPWEGKFKRAIVWLGVGKFRKSNQKHLAAEPQPHRSSMSKIRFKPILRYTEDA
jgi:hypothetical protein